MTSAPTFDSFDFKALFDSAPDAVIVHDLNSRVLYWNRVAEELYGWTSDEIYGQGIEPILYIDPEEREEAMQSLKEGRLWERELRQCDRNNDEHLVQVRQYLQAGPNGGPPVIVSFNTDITEIRRKGDALEHAKYVKSSSILAGGMAHELNNALAPIMLSSAMLKRFTKEEKAIKMADMIERCATKGAGLVSDLIAFEKGVGGGNEVIQRKQLERGIRAAGAELVPGSIDLEVNVDEALWDCRGEIQELVSCFKSVIQNACEAMPKGGHLKIDVSNRILEESFVDLAPDCPPGAYLSIVVSDTGVGIDVDALAHVAEPFYTTKSPSQGSGFGLSRTQATVKGHKGFMFIESESGVGTTLSVFLPADVTGLDVTDTESIVEEKRGSGELLLVVDDEIFIRDIMKTNLEASGYQVLTAKDGTDALAVYATHSQKIAMVITDAEMPFMNGGALCRVLMELDPDLKVLISTGHKETKRLETIRACGINEILTKPYTGRELANRVYAILAG